MPQAFTDEQLSLLKSLIQDAIPGESAPIVPDENAPEDATILRMEGMEKSITDILKIMEDMPALNSAGYKTDDGGEADPDHKSLGDFLLAIKRNDVKRIKEVYKSRHTDEVWAEDQAAKDMSGVSGPAGGYLVPSAFEPNLLEVAAPAAVVRPRASVFPVATSNGSIPSLDQYTAPTAGQGDSAFAGGVVLTWAGEGSAGSETQPAFKMIEYVVRKMAGYTEVPNEVIGDSAIAIETLLSRLFGVAVANMEDYVFLRGDGVGKPLGILMSPCAIAVTTAANNTFAYADSLAMRARFKAVGGKPVWVIHPGLWPDIGVFEIGTGGGVWQANARDEMAERLLGYPILESEHMPQDDNDDALLADLKAYTIFDRAGIAIAFSEHAAFTTDKGTWRVTKRLDGQPWLTDKITLADPQGSYTVSPFVYHDD